MATIFSAIGILATERSKLERAKINIANSSIERPGEDNYTLKTSWLNLTKMGLNINQAKC